MTEKSASSVCFVGLENLPVLAEEFNEHGIGGEQVQQTLMAVALARRGYNVSMVVGDYGQPDGAAWSGVTTYKSYRFNDGIPVLRFLYPRITKLWFALKRANADVYYVSCAGMLVGLVAHYARKHGKRVVFRIAHDSDCEPENLLISYWRDKKIYEYGLKLVDEILAQSLHQQGMMAENYRRQSTIASMLVESCPNPKSSCQRDIDVLWVNNIRQFKRPDLLMDLAEQMPSFRFTVVGGPVPGDEALFKEIKARAAKIFNLRFLGRVPYHQVNDFYARAKVLVNTSDSEGFPNSFLQAWVRGTPVISFFDPDNIISSKGLGATASSFSQLKSLVQSHLVDEASWRAASQRCIAHMSEKYDEDQIMRPYLKAFHFFKDGLNEATRVGESEI